MPLPNYTVPTTKQRTYKPARRGGGGYEPGEYNPVTRRREGTWNAEGTQETGYFGEAVPGLRLGNYQYIRTGTTNPHGMQVRRMYDMGRGDRGGGGGSRGSMRALADLSMLEDDIDVPEAPTFEAPAVPAMSEAMTAAERAALTRTKERSGLRMQSAMKALEGFAGEHNLEGSGREAGAMSDIFSSGLGEQAETERGLLASRTGRLRDLEDMDYGGRMTAAERNFSGAQEQNRLRVDAQRTRLDIARLLAQYGMGY